jgi:hypothetical protein
MHPRTETTKTQMSRNTLAEAVKSATREGGVLGPAEGETLAQAERRFGISLPTDMAQFYRSMNGTAYPTETNHGWVRLWDLGSWRRLRDDSNLSVETSDYRGLADAILFADHCDDSWYYAAEFLTESTGPRIYLVDGLRPAKLVAAGFTAFVEAFLADSADIYPD